MLQGQESWSAIPCQKNVYSCSPPVQRCQCWAAWARGWWWWFSWSHQPDLDHRRGQDTWSWHSSLLVSHKIGCFFILWRLPGARFTVCSSDIPLSYKHPLKQADGGGQHLTGWGQLEAGSNWLVGCNDPSHCQRQPAAPGTTSFGLSLWLVTAASCVGSDAVNSSTEEGTSLDGVYYKNPGVHSCQEPPLSITDVVQKRVYLAPATCTMETAGAAGR